MREGVRRRDVLLGGLGMIALTGYAGAVDDPAAARPKPGDLLVRDGDEAKTPLTPADIVDNAKPVVAWAMEPGGRIVRSGSRFNRLTIGRLGDQLFAFTVI